MFSRLNLRLGAVISALALSGCMLYAQTSSKGAAAGPPNLSSVIFGRPTAAPTTLPFVSTIFGDNMVLQRGKLDTIWGWSKPGDSVHVQFGNKSVTAVAAADRRWQAKIHPPATGGPYTMKITDGQQTAEFHNVMVGDVWLCAGQSNMETPLRFSDNGAQVAQKANYPNIRYFTEGQHSAYHPTYTLRGTWNVVTPQTANWVSAVAFYFAVQVQQKTHVPIGLVVASVGGAAAETFASAAALRSTKDYDVALAQVAELAAEGSPSDGTYITPWYKKYDVGLKESWFSPSYDASSWKNVPLPGGFAALGVPVTPAVAWFRKEVTLPNPLPPGLATMFLGQVQRMDSVWVNGTYIGGSAWVENPRVYRIRPGVLKPGKNLIAVRIFKTEPKGGFLDKPDIFHLVLGDHSSIPLAGEWQGKISVDGRPPQPLPLHYANWPVMATVLYNGMMVPLAPLSITGAIWYQAEQNSPRGYAYRKLLPAVIADWRNLFKQPNFPFHIVQLPAFGPRSSTPIDDAWADIRESQAITADTVPHSCLAVTIDTGGLSLHPGDKKPVGDRLADCALAKHYGMQVVYAGPTLASVKRLPHSIQLRFKDTSGGLVAKGGTLKGFSIAGSDRKWYWGDAAIHGQTVVVSSPSVPHPMQVRYAWQSDPAATLFNGAGLPAGPFRTDKWPLITQDQRPY